MNITTDTTQKIGRTGEAVAARFLEQRGYIIITRNWRAGRIGEIDLIATRDGTTVFVEVKTRRHVDAGGALEAVSPSKLSRMQRVALAWLAQEGALPHDYRFDVIGVHLAHGREPAFAWLQDVAQ